MRWEDEGILLSCRLYGETSVIAEIFTRGHGRTLGLIKGGRSRRIRPVLQAGNALRVEWRARLDDQLGVYTVELAEAYAPRVWDDPHALNGLTALAALLQVLPERDPHPRLYDAAEAYLKLAGTPGRAAEYAHFELALLDELGFGLDFSKCAATGAKENLIYVSPKSGQAVSAEAGEPYKSKLLTLPHFMRNRTGDAAMPHDQDIADGLRLTGYFLEKHVFEAAQKAMPRSRYAFTGHYSKTAIAETAT